MNPAVRFRNSRFSAIALSLSTALASPSAAAAVHLSGGRASPPDYSGEVSLDLDGLFDVSNRRVVSPTAIRLGSGYYDPTTFTHVQAASGGPAFMQVRSGGAVDLQSTVGWSGFPSAGTLDFHNGELVVWGGGRVSGEQFSSVRNGSDSIRDGSYTISVTGSGSLVDIAYFRDDRYQCCSSQSSGAPARDGIEVLNGGRLAVAGGGTIGSLLVSGSGSTAFFGGNARNSPYIVPSMFVTHYPEIADFRSLHVENGGFAEFASGVQLRETMRVSGTGSRVEVGGGIFSSSVYMDGVWSLPSVGVEIVSGGAMTAGTISLSSGRLLVSGTGSNVALGQFQGALEVEDGGAVTGDALSLWGGAVRGGTTSANVVDIFGEYTLGGGSLSANFLLVNGQLTMAGGNATAGTFFSESGTVEGHGTINARSLLEGNTTVTATGGELVMGDATDIRGFRSDGLLRIESGAKLTLASRRNFASLGSLTEIEGGTLDAKARVALGTGRAIEGHGSVIARVAANVGSTIIATGDLSLGKASAFDGFFSQGQLEVAEHTVTLNDRNEAVLGSYTSIGGDTAGSGGRLIAANGLLNDFGKVIEGHGTIIGDLRNNGLVAGFGPTDDDFLILDGRVDGAGDFAGIIGFAGEFDPGLSPTITEGDTFVLLAGSTTTLELGGLLAGDEHDQLRANEIRLGGTLAIALIDGFLPSIGDHFDLMIAKLFKGSFASHLYPGLREGLGWNLAFVDGVGGSSVLRLSVTEQAPVPVPAAVWLLGSVLAGMAGITRRRAA